MKKMILPSILILALLALYLAAGPLERRVSGESLSILEHPSAGEPCSATPWKAPTRKISPILSSATASPTTASSITWTTPIWHPT